MNYYGSWILLFTQIYEGYPESKFFTARKKKQNVITWKDLLQKLQ